MSDRKHTLNSTQAALLAGFLFGNVNEEGEIENEDWDKEMKACLLRLSHVKDVMNFAESAGVDEDTLTMSQPSIDPLEEVIERKLSRDDIVWRKKSSFAIDFENMEELADDLTTTVQRLTSLTPIEVRNKIFCEEDYDNDRDQDMDKKSAAESRIDQDYSGKPSWVKPELSKHEIEKRLCQAFPGFEYGKVLKFSELFGPKKYEYGSLFRLLRKTRLQCFGEADILDKELDERRLFVVQKLDRNFKNLSQLWKKDTIGRTQRFRDGWSSMPKAIKGIYVLLPEDGDFRPLILDNWERKIVWDDGDEEITSDRGIPREPESQRGLEISTHNEDLEEGRWVNGIVWDTDQISEFLNNTFVLLDLNDFHIPYDISPSQMGAGGSLRLPTDRKAGQTPSKRSKKHDRGTEKSHQDEGSSILSCKNTIEDLSGFSNDKYYETAQISQALKVKHGLDRVEIEHSVPARKLMSPFCRTHLSKAELRSFHRPRLYFPSGETNRFMLPRRRKHEFSDQDELIHETPRSPKDICLHDDSEFLLFEYSEESPSLLMNPGMATMIYNYYRKKSSLDDSTPWLPCGKPKILETTDESPFMSLGEVGSGETVQALYNNLFIAPIFRHPSRSVDFLAIRYKNRYYLREIPSIMVVGQEFPYIEVPAPKSRQAYTILKSRLESFIIRHFRQKGEEGRILKTMDVSRAFPGYADLSIRRLLKAVADFNRVGISGFWTLNKKIQLPGEHEIQSMIQPEMVCAYESMLAGLQFLKDAGYDEESRLEEEIDEEDHDTNQDTSGHMDDEVKLAPWNVTRAFIRSQQGKCTLELTGVGDPTGKGEGFSYIRSGTWQTESGKRLSLGMDGDGQKKWTSAEARRFLRENDVPEEEIMKLARVQLLSRARKLWRSKHTLVPGERSKSTRNLRDSVEMLQQKQKEQALRIWEAQAASLSNPHPLEEVHQTPEVDSNVDNILSELDEEEDRRLFRKFLDEELFPTPTRRSETEGDVINHSDANMGGGVELNLSRKNSKILGGEFEDDLGSNPSQETKSTHLDSKILRIERLIALPSGEKSWRTEIVRDPFVIEAYLRARAKKQLVTVAASSPGADRLTEPSSRGGGGGGNSITTGQGEDQQQTTTFIKRYGVNKDKVITTKCSACGQVGHKRNNRQCPMYEGPAEDALDFSEEQEFVRIEGTKISFSTAMMQKAIGNQEIRKRRRTHDFVDEENEDLDALHAIKASGRRKRNPEAALAFMLERVWNRLKSFPDAWPFMKPVSTKIAPDYHEVVSNPKDLGTIREQIEKMHYKSSEEFLDDIRIMANNCRMYNGAMHPFTKAAEELVQLAETGVQEEEAHVAELERRRHTFFEEESEDEQQHQSPYFSQRNDNAELPVVSTATTASSSKVRRSRPRPSQTHHQALVVAQEETTDSTMELDPNLMATSYEEHETPETILEQSSLPDTVVPQNAENTDVQITVDETDHNPPISGTSS